MLLSPKEWEEKSLQEQSLRPPAIKSSYFKIRGLKKKKKSIRFTRAFQPASAQSQSDGSIEWEEN